MFSNNFTTSSSGGGMMIPRVIHFMWLDSKNKNNQEHPAKYNKYIQSWMDHHPYHKVKIWYNKDVDKIWEHLFAISYLSVYRHMRHIEKCDMSRYLIMYLYGGIYVDLNVMCYRNIEPLLEGKNIAFVREPEEHRERFQFEYLVTNSFLASVPKNLFWASFMDYIKERYWSTNDNKYVMINTGPYILARYIDRYHKSDDIFIDTCYGMIFVNEDKGNNIISESCKYKHPNTDPSTYTYFAKHWRDTARWGQVDDAEGVVQFTLPPLIRHTKKWSWLLILLLVPISVLILYLIARVYLYIKHANYS